MFDLETAIRSWRETFLGREGVRAAQADELEDHLRQEVDRLRAGVQERSPLLSEEEAFLLAARRLGSTERLAEEFRKSDPRAVWRQRWIWMLCGYLGIGLAISLVSAAAALTLATAQSSGLDARIAVYFLVVLAGAAGTLALARFVARSETRSAPRLGRGLRSTAGLVALTLTAIALTAAVSSLPGVVVAWYASPSGFGLMETSGYRWMALAWGLAGLKLVPFLALAGLLWRERARSERELPAPR
jgi:hypothetical protein